MTTRLREWRQQHRLTIPFTLAVFSFVFGFWMLPPCNQQSPYTIYVACRNCIPGIITPLWIWGIVFCSAGLLYWIGQYYKKIGLSLLGCCIGVSVWFFAGISIGRQQLLVGAPYLNLFLAYMWFETAEEISRPQTSP